MKVELSVLEQRVIGCLVEKQVTTPEQYPMSLNALTNACNQKSNRDPVLTLPETEVQALIDGLSRKHLVLERSGFGSRVPKYQHRFCNTEFSVFQFTPQERAIVCELLLRGAQTPGELRSRAARMAEFSDAAQVESALEALAARDSGPLVRRLAREPGRRESRYAHLFGPDAATLAATDEEAPLAAASSFIHTAPASRAAPGSQAAPASADATSPMVAPPAAADAALSDRVTALEREVALLRQQIERLGGTPAG